ncbi:hypothetical protein ADIARSV_2680 [Arcticibacter svalbardensis MN12-7]|uniref:Viral A-type inclusion protein n=1 Tax=Arcticibacter svalbardensis MN12-7 TaxID=1150600 RepID=R9GRN8_9SPHI|nr:hypothetical protein [Arcticibacter svalbardensis]EOR94185.1 hypothetical protein ADIARSV_2680 [Arcticibacter svalbardensis MN12-7]
MKKSILFLFVPFLIQSCSSSGSYKDVMDEVLKIHDKVMMDSELAIRNRMKLDTLSSNLGSLAKIKPNLDTMQASKKIQQLKAELDQADSKMNAWMKGFEVEPGKKSNDEAVAYYKEEEKKIKALDNLFQKVIKQSDDFLAEVKK